MAGFNLKESATTLIQEHQHNGLELSTDGTEPCTDFCPLCGRPVTHTQWLELKEQLRKQEEARAAENLASQQQELAAERAKLMKEHQQQNQRHAQEMAQLRGKLKRDELDRQRGRDETHARELGEKDLIIVRMRREIDSARRRADQAAPEVRGRVLEDELIKLLQNECPADAFERIATGARGGDFIQRVRAAGRAVAGILIECKNTAVWQNAWLPKARADARRCGANVAMIVSVALPKGVEGFALIDEVLVTGPRYACALVRLVRQELVAHHQLLAGRRDRGSRADKLFQYVTGTRFRQRIREIVELYGVVERRAGAAQAAMIAFFNKHWEELAQFLNGVAALYGDVAGVAGDALPEVEEFKLPAPDSRQLPSPAPARANGKLKR